MDTAHILKHFEQFITGDLKDRFFKHQQITTLLKQLPPAFVQTLVGKSFQGRDISLIKWGKGPIKVFLWSQMHGDEPTGTMAIFDLFTFLTGSVNQELSNQIQQHCTLYFMPMVNPDGAEQFVRRNAQHIDVNRDFNKLVSPEARILRKTRDAIQPDFGFNLHDQSTLWSVKKAGKPAALSFLAPAYDEALTTDAIRERAMLVIADMFQAVQPLLPNQIGLFDDEYEPRAFGDNFQALGTSTILIEAGGYEQDTEKQEIRKHYFIAMLTGLQSIATGAYKRQNLNNYFNIPSNNKEIFHILIKDLIHQQTSLSIGLCYEEEPVNEGLATEKVYIIQDIGDLNHLGAYEILEGQSLELQGIISIYKPANFIIFKGKEIILEFKNGILQSKL